LKIAAGDCIDGQLAIGVVDQSHIVLRSAKTVQVDVWRGGAVREIPNINRAVQAIAIQLNTAKIQAGSNDVAGAIDRK